MEGFVKLDRGLLEWEWYKNEHTKSVFIHCLLKAYWKDTKIEGILIPRGSFISSNKKLSDELGLTLQEVRTAIKHLKSTNELTSKGSNKNTVFTVVNYDLYQSKEQAEQQTSNKQVTNEQQTNNKQSTGKKQTNNNQITTNEEYKEIEETQEIQEREEEKNTTIPQGDSTTQKKKPKEEKHRYGEYQHVLLTDRQFERLVNDYGEFEVHEAIKFLDEYIQMKGYKAKDHNLAIRKWVFGAVEEEKNKNNQQRTGSSDDYWAGI